MAAAGLSSGGGAAASAESGLIAVEPLTCFTKHLTLDGLFNNCLKETYDNYCCYLEANYDPDYVLSYEKESFYLLFLNPDYVKLHDFLSNLETSFDEPFFEFFRRVFESAYSSESHTAVNLIRILYFNIAPSKLTALRISAQALLENLEKSKSTSPLIYTITCCLQTLDLFTKTFPHSKVLEFLTREQTFVLALFHIKKMFDSTASEKGKFDYIIKIINYTLTKAIDYVEIQVFIGHLAHILSPAYYTNLFENEALHLKLVWLRAKLISDFSFNEAVLDGIIKIASNPQLLLSFCKDLKALGLPLHTTLTYNLLILAKTINNCQDAVSFYCQYLVLMGQVRNLDFENHLVNVILKAHDIDTLIELYSQFQKITKNADIEAKIKTFSFDLREEITFLARIILLDGRTDFDDALLGSLFPDIIEVAESGSFVFNLSLIHSVILKLSILQEAFHFREKDSLDPFNFIFTKKIEHYRQFKALIGDDENINRYLKTLIVSFNWTQWDICSQDCLTLYEDFFALTAHCDERAGRGIAGVLSLKFCSYQASDIPELLERYVRYERIFGVNPGLLHVVKEKLRELFLIYLQEERLGYACLSGISHQYLIFKRIMGEEVPLDAKEKIETHISFLEKKTAFLNECLSKINELLRDHPLKEKINNLIRNLFKANKRCTRDGKVFFIDYLEKLLINAKDDAYYEIFPFISSIPELASLFIDVFTFLAPLPFSAFSITRPKSEIDGISRKCLIYLRERGFSRGALTSFKLKAPCKRWLIYVLFCLLTCADMNLSKSSNDVVTSSTATAKTRFDFLFSTYKPLFDAALATGRDFKALFTEISTFLATNPSLTHFLIVNSKLSDDSPLSSEHRSSFDASVISGGAADGEDTTSLDSSTIMTSAPKGDRTPLPPSMRGGAFSSPRAGGMSSTPVFFYYGVYPTNLSRGSGSGGAAGGAGAPSTPPR